MLGSLPEASGLTGRGPQSSAGRARRHGKSRRGAGAAGRAGKLAKKKAHRIKLLLPRRPPLDVQPATHFLRCAHHLYAPVPPNRGGRRRPMPTPERLPTKAPQDRAWPGPRSRRQILKRATGSRLPRVGSPAAAVAFRAAISEAAVDLLGAFSCRIARPWADPLTPPAPPLTPPHRQP